MQIMHFMQADSFRGLRLAVWPPVLVNRIVKERLATGRWFINTCIDRWFRYKFIFAEGRKTAVRRMAEIKQCRMAERKTAIPRNISRKGMNDDREQGEAGSQARVSYKGGAQARGQGHEDR